MLTKKMRCTAAGLLASIGVATLLVVLSISPLSADTFRPSDPNRIRQWEGTYKGFIDGRHASLTIAIWDGTRISGSCLNNVTRRSHSGRLYINVTLKDLDHGVTWYGQCIRAFSDDAPDEYIWKNLRLRQKIGSDIFSGRVENVGTYYLHTWDTDFISGFNKSGSKNFGRLFIRASRALDSCDPVADCDSARWD
jgi:hypothetical protein